MVQPKVAFTKRQIFFTFWTNPGAPDFLSSRMVRLVRLWSLVIDISEGCIHEVNFFRKKFELWGMVHSKDHIILLAILKFECETFNIRNIFIPSSEVYVFLLLCVFIVCMSSFVFFQIYKNFAEGIEHSMPKCSFWYFLPKRDFWKIFNKLYNKSYTTPKFGINVINYFMMVPINMFKKVYFGRISSIFDQNGSISGATVWLWKHFCQKIW